jgi:hypothetical protein
VKTAGVVGVAVGVSKAAALGAAGAVGSKVVNEIAGDGMEGTGIKTELNKAVKVVKDIPVKDIIAKLTKPQLQKVESLAKRLMKEGDKAIDSIAKQALPVVTQGIQKAINAKRVIAGKGLKRSGEGLKRSGGGLARAGSGNHHYSEKNEVGSELKKEMLKYHGV